MTFHKDGLNPRHCTPGVGNALGSALHLVHGEVAFSPDMNAICPEDDRLYCRLRPGHLNSCTIRRDHCQEHSNPGAERV